MAAALLGSSGQLLSDVLAQNEPCDVQAAFSGLHTLWRRTKGAGLVPRRAAFTAETLHSWLPSIVILDQIDTRYRFRLIGTAIVATSGCDVTGRYIDEIVSPLFYAPVIASYRRAANLARPVEDNPAGDPLFADARFAERSRRLILPCSRCDGPIDTFVACMLFSAVRPVS
jgi:hypothetical protein